jgi:TonB family protein
MQNYIFIISLFFVSMLHASFLAWSSFTTSSTAKISNQFSRNSISISVKAKKSTKKKELKQVAKKSNRPKIKEHKKDNRTSSPELARGEMGTNNQAKLIGSLNPEFPHLSKIYEEEGKVSLEAHIEPSGSVSQVKLLKSTGYQRLDSSAINALKKAKFSPATKSGKPVKSSKVIDINFTLQ